MEFLEVLLLFYVVCSSDMLLELAKDFISFLCDKLVKRLT